MTIGTGGTAGDDPAAPEPVVRSVFNALAPADAEKLIDLRLASAKSAHDRASAVLAFCTLLSIAIVVTAYNAYLSWNEHFAQAQFLNGTTAHVDASGVQAIDVTSPVTEKAHELALAQWVDGRRIQVPLLGMSIAIDDTAVLGSLAVAIIAYVSCYVMRRQHTTVAGLLRDMASQDVRARAHVYFSLIAYRVFATVHREMRPLDLETLSPGAASDGAKSAKLGIGFCFLVLLPVLAVAGVLACDYYSLTTWKAPFRFPHVPIAGQLTDRDRLRAYAYLAFGGAVSLAAGRWLVDVLLYERATLRLLREFRVRLENDARCQLPD